MRTVVDELRDLGKQKGFAGWQMSGYDSACAGLCWIASMSSPTFLTQ